MFNIGGFQSLSVGAACDSFANAGQSLANQFLGFFGAKTTLWTNFCGVLDIPNSLNNLIDQFNTIFGGILG